MWRTRGHSKLMMLRTVPQMNNFLVGGTASREVDDDKADEEKTVDDRACNDSQTHCQKLSGSESAA